MAQDNDVVVRVELPVSTGRDVAHGNVFRAFDAGGFVFPRLANVD
jgi:hypothetical protein